MVGRLLRLVGLAIATSLTLGACTSAEPVRSETLSHESPTPSLSPAKQESAIPVIAATVLRVIDGDTAEMRLEDATTERVRFIGVDAPERGHLLSSEATNFAERSLDGGTVYLQLDVEKRDRYGRLLAYVWLSRPLTGDAEEVRERMFNARLLSNGLALLLTIPPNVAFVNFFRQFQAEARELKRGLWGLKLAEQVGTLDARCDPSYPGICIRPPPPDLDCRDVPHRRFQVRAPDPHRFDADGDGVGCEAG